MSAAGGFSGENLGFTAKKGGAWKKIKNFAEYLLNENFNVKLMMYISDKEKLLYIIKLK